MSSLVDTLAARCVMTKEAMSGANLDDPKLREMRLNFDQSVARETNLRNHAKRLRELAKSESASEPSGIVPTVVESTGRLLPVPRSISETLIRAPIIGAGALAGRHLFRSQTDSRLKAMARSLTSGKVPSFKQLSRPELNKDNYSLGMRGVVGGLAGAAAGSVISGIPYAISHAVKKVMGGESSFDSSGHANKAEQQAQREFALRNKILGSLPSTKIEKLPASEVAHDRGLTETELKAASVAGLVYSKIQEQADA